MRVKEDIVEDILDTPLTVKDSQSGTLRITSKPKEQSYKAFHR